MDYREFLEHQEEVYERGFRRKTETVRRDGTLSDPVLMERQGGQFVAFRYPAPVANRVALFSQGLGQITGVTPYSVDVIHTTIGTINVRPAYQGTESDGQRTVLPAVAEVVRRVIKG